MHSWEDSRCFTGVLNNHLASLSPQVAWKERPKASGLRKVIAQTKEFSSGLDFRFSVRATDAKRGEAHSKKEKVIDT